jgi:hypothetical protein
MLVICGEANNWCKKRNCEFARSIKLEHLYDCSDTSSLSTYVAAKNFIDMDIPWHIECKRDMSFVTFLKRYVKE